MFGFNETCIPGHPGRTKHSQNDRRTCFLVNLNKIAYLDSTRLKKQSKTGFTEILAS